MYIETFGPVCLFWISQLSQKLTFLSDSRRLKALYCTRAGKRILDLMQAFHADRTPFACELFGISRISACKAGFGHLSAYDQAFKVSYETLGGSTLADACRAFLAHSWRDGDIRHQELARHQIAFDRHNFRSLLAANDPASLLLKNYFDQTHDALEKWLTGQLSDYDGCVLVDTGWKASIQYILSAAYPEIHFEGLYFGVMDRNSLPNRTGIIFDAPSYVKGRPATSFTLHRHLIESMLEPDTPSVEEVLGGPNHAVAERLLSEVKDEQPTPDNDRMFLSMLDYVGRHRDMPFDDIVEGYVRAIRNVERMLLHPTREEALHLAGKDRSIDFGRLGQVPVLLTEQESPQWSTADERVRHALWPQGQIALEYDGKIAHELQLKAAGVRNSTTYFVDHQDARTPLSAAQDGKHPDWTGSVAIVTRTKNRPLLFERATRSVAGQTYQNYQWVIVNDGGDLNPVMEIVESSLIDQRRITVISNEKSVGMEAASNLGVRAVDTEFVVIHDDDDAWEPQFLEESIKFLQSPEAQSACFKGVVSRAYRVSEQIDGDKVIIHNRSSFHPWVSEVTISQMAVGNFFAPISFVYRREVYDEIGGYDESLPVLGDWRFNFDFLVRANIGFLDVHLSHYHHRDRGDSTTQGVYANSVVGGQPLHAKYFSVVVNGLLRDPKLPPAVALTVGQGHMIRIMEHRLNSLDASVRELQSTINAMQASNADKENVATKDVSQKAHRTTPSEERLPPQDREYVLGCLMKANLLKRPRDYAALMRQFDDVAVRRKVISQNYQKIPSPEDFDYVAYLRDHPEIWATEYNGIGEKLPYHHYLTEGVEKGFARPVRKQ